jgi:iron complex outermembrane recepter protein
MYVKHYYCPSGFQTVIAVFVLLQGIQGLQAQTKQLLTWQEDLAGLQNASGDELTQNREAVQQIRNGIEFYLRFHPSSTAALPGSPPQPWGVEDTRNQVAALRQVLETIIKEDPSRPFNLGSTVVSVSVEASPLSPLTDSLTGKDIADRQVLTVATALENLPGVSVDEPTGSRNEAYGRIRGFSTRGQVPFYLDGIPVYVPYDGFVDMNRFLTSNIAEIQIAKGYSSPLMGPNALAGSINLVTRRPEKKLDANVLSGYASGRQGLSSLGLGSRWNHFYVQGSFDWLQRDYIPLSGDFTLNRFQTSYRRNNSASRDEKWSGRIAWTPKGGDQYSFSYINQKGKKDGLQYIGPSSTATYSSFWKWPYWNKNGYYLITNTGIGESSSIKFRAYYDQFRNALDIYDDGTYTTMLKSGSEHSKYSDYTDGASSEFTTRLLPRNVISASVYFKDDTHRSVDAYPGVSPYPKIYPMQRLRDQQVSIGFQDVISPTSRLHVTFGFSADHLKGLFVSGYNSDNTQLIPLTCPAEPGNTSFSGCAAHVWTYNPQVSASYNLTKFDTLFFIISDRARFPLLKDSYSYRFNKAWPNPDLGPEHSRNLDFGYSRAFAGHTLMQIEYYRNNLRDAIQMIYMPSTSCPGNTGILKGTCGINYNAGQELHEGAEISIRTSPIRRLRVDASYTFLNRTIGWNYDNIPSTSLMYLSNLTLPSMAKNKFVGNASFSLPHGILVMASFRYEGGIRIQDTNVIPTPNAFGGTFGVLDIGTVVPIAAGFKLQAGIKNLLDRDYYYAAGYPQAGRNSYFNLRYTF